MDSTSAPDGRFTRRQAGRLAGALVESIPRLPYGALHEKLAASWMLPVPLYTATCG